jgi:hypothetical protein
MNENNDVRILRGCKILFMEIDYLNDKIRKERALLSGRGNPLTDMPKAGGESRDTYDAISDIERLQMVRRQKIQQYVDQIICAERILTSVQDGTRRMMCRLLYVERQPAWKVAKTLGVSERTIKDWKAKTETLENLRQYIG